MSKSQSIAFFEEISKNKQLAQEVEKVVGGKNSDETKAKELISLAKEHGFNFTQKEAASAQGELKKSLSPEELLEVSGGKGGFKSSLMAMALLAGLGVGGAAMSSMEASAMDGDNHQKIQVPGGQAAEQQGARGGDVNVDADISVTRVSDNEQNEHLGEGGDQQRYDATLSYNYVNIILRSIQNLSSMIIENIKNYQKGLDELSSYGAPEKLITESKACSQQVISTGKLNSGFFHSFIATDKWLCEHSGPSIYEPDGGNTVELLLEYAGDNERYRESNMADAIEYNSAALAAEINAHYTRIANGYRALAERILANGGCVNDAIINELIELRIMDQDNAYLLRIALKAARQQHETLVARIKYVLARAYEHDLALGIPMEEANANRARNRQRLMDNPTEIDDFEAFIEEAIIARKARKREMENEQLRRDPRWHLRLETVLMQLYEHHLALGLSEEEANANREQTRQRLMDNPTEIDAFEEETEAREREVREIRARANEQLRHDPNWPSRVEAVLTRAYNYDLALGLSEAVANANRERDRQRLMADPAEIDAFEAFIEREIEAQLGAGTATATATATTALRPAQQNRETVSRQTISGNIMLQVRGENHIEAWSNTHIHSFSNNELMHEGDGAVDVDLGDIIISDFSNGQTARDVTINNANSLAVAPGIPTRTQNGTEFTMGENLQETAENILRALSPNSLQEILSKFGSSSGSK